MGPDRYIHRMKPRHSILLSPYRLPTESTLYLGDEEIAAFLNGMRALWHPAALACSEALPRVASPYDHEDPADNLLVAVPDNPPLTLPDDWRDRAKAAGAVVFTATPSWDETLANLREALLEGEKDREHVPALCALGEEQAAPFHAIGFGCMQLEALFEAMQQENLIGSPELVEDIALAVGALAHGDAETTQAKLQSAAERMQSAREIVYPVAVHVIDLALHLDRPWPAAYESGLPVNFIASGQEIETLPEDRLAALRERVVADLAEVISGGYREREEPLLPLESQLANIRLAQKVHREKLGQELRVYGRRRGGLHAQLPLLLQSSGIAKCLLVSFDDAVLPSYSAPVVSWPSADGKQVDGLARTPQPAESPQTYFHLAHHLHQTIMQDQSATLAVMHREVPAPVWYRDWLTLSTLAPVLGKWETLTQFFNDVLTGDYTAASSPDELSTDFLAQRTTAAYGEEPPPPLNPRPISDFPILTRQRRRLDAALTFAGLLRALRGDAPAEALAELEERYERGEVADDAEVQAALDQSAQALAQRLVTGAPANPGWLVLNPCAFARRVPVELSGCPGPVAVEGPVKASQLDGDTARLVVEVPALGFAWVPRPPAGGQQPPARMKMADERTIRNEFFEAEVDEKTGGLRGMRDQKMRLGRMAQQLVYNPGSTMQATSIQVTSTGPALGEIVSEGNILDEQGQPLARFRQRFRAWLGRPVLDIRVEIEPVGPVEGYAWHAYYASRFAWRDEIVPLLRGYQGQPTLTTGTRPESPDFVELRVGRPNTVIFPAGLPFHQRHGGRMLDVLLMVEGETARTFDLTVGIDREQPMQTALGVVSPVAVVPLTQGPPRVGPSGWLFHLDAPNVVLSTLRPAAGDAVLATLLETASHYGAVTLRCVRDPVKATVQDLAGTDLYDATLEGDAVHLDITSCDLLRVLVQFS